MTSIKINRYVCYDSFYSHSGNNIDGVRVIEAKNGKDAAEIYARLQDMISDKKPVEKRFIRIRLDMPTDLRGVNYEEYEVTVTWIPLYTAK